MDLRDQISMLTGGIILARRVLEERRMAKAQGLMALAKLAASLKESDGKAGGLAARLAGAVDGLNSEMGTTMSIVETVEHARDTLRAINQAVLPGDNGAPPLDVGSTISSASAPISARPSESAHLAEVKSG